jgi:hypothetical protein
MLLLHRARMNRLAERSEVEESFVTYERVPFGLHPTPLPTRQSLEESSFNGATLNHKLHRVQFSYPDGE